MFAWPCSVTNGVVGKKKCSLWCNTETFFNNNNNGKASTSLLSAFYLSQLISYRASGGRRITNVFCFSPPSRKAYELTLKYIPVRVTSFPSRVLVHLLVHARIHFCTHTHPAWLHLFHRGSFISFSCPRDFMNISAVSTVSSLVTWAIPLWPWSRFVLWCLFIHLSVLQVRLFISFLVVLLSQGALAFVSWLYCVTVCFISSPLRFSTVQIQ